MATQVPALIQLSDPRVAAQLVTTYVGWIRAQRRILERLLIFGGHLGFFASVQNCLNFCVLLHSLHLKELKYFDHFYDQSISQICLFHPPPPLCVCCVLGRSGFRSSCHSCHSITVLQFLLALFDTVVHPDMPLVLILSLCRFVTLRITSTDIVFPVKSQLLIKFP